MDNKKDYQVIEGKGREFQKTLNQWKHMYELNILHTTIFPPEQGEMSSWMVVILTRYRY